MQVEVFIEIPKGSRNKYEYDKERGVIKLDRMLFSSVHYPTAYGFIPETLAEDGDPLDALVLVWDSTFPGCIIDSKAVGVFLMEDEKGVDEKILCVPMHDPQWNHISSLSDVPPHLLREIEHFFNIYKDLEDNKSTHTQGWADRGRAMEIIYQCIERHKKNEKKSKKDKED
jgi:inorganic pyrophosphatase